MFKKTQYFIAIVSQYIVQLPLYRDAYRIARYLSIHTHIHLLITVLILLKKVETNLLLFQSKYMSLFISLAQVVIFWSLALVFLRYRLELVDYKMPLMQFGCISFFFFYCRKHSLAVDTHTVVLVLFPGPSSYLAPLSPGVCSVTKLLTNL